jgi:hypothetical protein
VSSITIAISHMIIFDLFQTVVSIVVENKFIEHASQAFLGFVISISHQELGATGGLDTHMKPGTEGVVKGTFVDDCEVSTNHLRELEVACIPVDGI